MEEANERLKRARRDAGYDTAAAAAERFGWKRFTYFAHENGTRGLRKDAAERYARAFKVSAAWLLTGEQRGAVRVLPLSASVRAGGELCAMDDHAKGAGLDEVEAPPGCPDNAVAVVVRGDSCRPELNPGDTLIYWRHLPPEDLLFRRAVVALTDGRRFIKTITPGSAPSRFTLTSPNASPLADQDIEWAAPIEWIKSAPI
ncbi:MAG: XRE family transcriptional regulator [Oceanicaulis sp.]